MKSRLITLRGRWREELEAVGPAGTLIFEFMMGKEHVYLPDENAWVAQAPAWARDKRQVYLEACEAWCKEYRYPISIVSNAHMYAEQGFDTIQRFNCSTIQRSQ